MPPKSPKKSPKKGSPKKGSPKTSPKGAGQKKSAKDSSKDSSAKDKKGRTYIPPMDALVIKVMSLKLTEEHKPIFAINIMFGEQLIVSSIIRSTSSRDPDEDKVIARGKLLYDPSDYEKMAQFADNPLIVNISPIKDMTPYEGWLDGLLVPMNSNTEIDSIINQPLVGPTVTRTTATNKTLTPLKTKSDTGPPSRSPSRMEESSLGDVSCCNIDILPLFTDTDKMCIRKRMQPMITPSILLRKSWDNLPLLTLSITAIRNEDNVIHHRMLRGANWMKVSLIGAFNMMEPYTSECYYFAATRNATYSNTDPTKLASLVTYSEGMASPKNLNYLKLYPKWESVRSADIIFAKADELFSCDISQIHNPEGVPDLEHYLKNADREMNVIFGSFHRSLLMAELEKNMWNLFQRWKWPLEMHFYGEGTAPVSLMACLDMYPLLYAGANKMVIAVPLQPHNAHMMAAMCNCNVLILPADVKKLTAGNITPQPTAKGKTPQRPTQTAATMQQHLHTSAAERTPDANPPFVLIEVLLGRPLVPESIPPFIYKTEIMKMLEDLESVEVTTRSSGRGQLTRDWKDIVYAATKSLGMVPQQGLTDVIILNRQLSETRTRTEIMTSFILEAAIFTNNNFVTQKFLESDELYQELLRMTHVCLMQSAVQTLFGRDRWHDMDSMHRAARHARQVNDMQHAVLLFTQAVTQRPFDGGNWRELATCLKDLDPDMARVCLNQAISLDIRNPLTLISKACMAFEEHAHYAEPFFVALLSLYPYWPTAYYICYAYYTARELFRMAHEVMQGLEFIRKENMVVEIPMARSWEQELGDFWEPTLLVTGMCPFYEVADLLMRLRGIRLAEVCLALALTEAGQTVAYYHLVAVCYRLSGDFENALCLVHEAIERYGEMTYLRHLEAECLYQCGDKEAALSVFHKIGSPATNSYCVLLALPAVDPPIVRSILVDLLRRQPSAYGWIALADDWIRRAGLTELVKGEPECNLEEARKCAMACAVLALKWDRRAGRAWTILAQLARPLQRRKFCSEMADLCVSYGEETFMDMRSLQVSPTDSQCHRFGVSLRGCRCTACIPTPLDLASVI